MILTQMLRRYLKLAPVVSDDLLQAAYHKSGHIVLAYSYGYSCHRVDLKEAENIDLHYKEDLMLVAGILSYSIDPCLFDNLPEFSRRKAAMVTGRLINMLCAGYLAQQKIVRGDHGIAEICDKLIENPPSSVARLRQFHETVFETAQDRTASKFFIQSIAGFLEIGSNWKQVDSLARHLLNAPGQTLDQHSIEKLLGRPNVTEMSFRASVITQLSELKSRKIMTSPLAIDSE
ncbi:MAG: hypothetical protein ABW036_05515 [Flavitalea sp.]